MYKGQSQSVIQGTFNKLYDLIQDTQEANYFKRQTTLHALLHKLLKKYKILIIMDNSEAMYWLAILQ